MKTVIQEMEAIKKRPSLSPFTVQIMLECALASRAGKDGSEHFCKLIQEEIDKALNKTQLIDIISCIGRFREFRKFQEKFRKEIGKEPVKKSIEELLTNTEKNALKKLDEIVAI